MAAFPAGGSQDCSATGWTLTRKAPPGSSGAQDPGSLSQFEPTVISYIQAHLVQTYLDINATAPSADIVVVGYPQVFPADPTMPCNSGSLLGNAAKLTPNAQVMINQFGTDLDTAISQAVAQVKSNGVAIQYVNPTAAFTGHEMCSSAPWFQPISLTDPVTSYHPTADGQQAYATVVNDCLAGRLEC